MAGESRHLIPYNIPRKSADTYAPHHDDDDDDELRSIFAFMYSACANSPVGKKHRQCLAEDAETLVLNNNTDIPAPYNDGNASRIQIKCQASGGGVHQDYLAKVEDSVFCLIPQGDTPSSLRSAEIPAHGCVPVFVGPPFHTIYLPEIFDWDSMAIFICVQNCTRWNVKHENWPNCSDPAADPIRQRHGENFVIVDDLLDIYAALGRVHVTRYPELRAGVEKARQMLLLAQDPFDIQLRDEVDFFPTPPYIETFMQQVVLPNMEKSE